MYHDGPPTDLALSVRTVPDYPTGSDRRAIRLLYLACAVFACATFLLLVGLARPAGAADDIAPVAEPLGATVSLDATMVAILAGAVIPLLTGLVTKLSASPGLKGLLSLLLSVVVAFISQFVIATDGTFEIETAVVYLFVSFTSAIASYYGVWKPTGATTHLAPNSGLG